MHLWSSELLMPGISKEDIGKIEKLLEQYDRLSRKIKRLKVPTTIDQRHKVASEVDELRRQVTLDIMRGIPVQALSPTDITASELQEVEDLHLDNLAQVVEWDPEEGSPRGTRHARHLAQTVEKDSEKGPETALSQSVMQVSKGVFSNIKKLVGVHVDEVGKPRLQGQMLYDLCLIDMAAPFQPRLKSAKDRFEDLKDLENELRQVPTGIGRIFIGRKRREKITNNIALLSKGINSINYSLSIIDDNVLAALSFSLQDAWQEYSRNKEEFESAIKEIAGVGVTDTLPVSSYNLALTARHFLGRIDAVKADASSLDIPDDEEYRQEAFAAINRLRDLEVQKRLEKLDIDVLAQGGARIGSLKSAGFHSVGDLVGLSAYNLSRYSRVSFDTAQMVSIAVSNISASLRKSTSVHFYVDSRTVEQTELLRLLYGWNRWPELRAKTASIRSDAAHLEKATSDLRVVKTGWLDSLAMLPSQLEKLNNLICSNDYLLSSLEERQANLAEECNKVAMVTDDDVWNDFSHHVADYYTLLEQLGGMATELPAGELPNELVEQVASLDLDLSRMKKPIRPYQKFGAQYALHQRMSLIGDEMGLGKTVETITAMAHLSAKGEKCFAVICPLSVLVNWTREISQFSTLRTVVLHGNDRDSAMREWIHRGGVGVTTFGTVSKLPWYLLKGRAIGLLAVDEAQNIKNPNAIRTQALTHMVMPHAKDVVLLSGTPLENRVQEMNTLVSYLNPTVANEVSSGEVLMNPIEYRKRLAPVYLRRKREDVLHDLPDKIEKEDWCTMTDVDERDYLVALRQGSFSAMRRVGWRHTDIDYSAKAARLLEICDEARENGDKILVFSFYLDTINKVARLVGDQCAGVINGGVAGPERQRIVDEFSSSDKSVLVAQVIAGGVGLNIQAANVVVFCEPQIKPSIEDQAISRAYRMGQPKAVMVHRLYMDQTVDEKIREILARKRRDFDMYADKSEIGRQSLKVIDTDAIMQIIQEERKRHGIDPSLPVNAKDSAKSDT